MPVESLRNVSMMRHVKSIDPQHALADDFEPGPLPPMSPDGTPLLEAASELAAPAPRLCAVGPCRHYHTFQTRFDAQDPLEERRPDGTLIRHGRALHLEQHHYCYPDVGIESNLTSLPVFECNRWSPVRALLRRVGAMRREYDRDLAAWRSAESVPLTPGAELLAPEARSGTIIMVGLEIGCWVNGPPFAGSAVDGCASGPSGKFAPHPDWKLATYQATSTTTLDAIVAHALAVAEIEGVVRVEVRDNDDETTRIDNRAITLGELGHAPGSIAKFTILFAASTTTPEKESTVR